MTTGLQVRPHARGRGSYRLGQWLTAVSMAALGACGEDFGEDLPPGGFTTGPDPTDPGTGTSAGSTHEVTSSSAESSDDGSTDNGTGTDSGSTTGNASTSTTSTSTSTSTTSTTSTTTDDTSTTANQEDTTTGVNPPQCSDGTADPGDVCFLEAAVIPIGGNEPVDVVAGDFDGDGNVDLATANASGTVSVLLGDGNGTFGASVQLPVGTDPVRLHAANFNGDGNDDLVVLNRGDNSFSVLIADGAGSFAAPVAYAVGTGPEDIGIGDLTGDGRDEVIVANAGSGNLSTAANDGTGLFTVLGPWNSTNGIATPAGATFGEVALGAPQDAFIVGGGAWGARPGLATGALNNQISVGAPVIGAVGLRRVNKGSADGDAFVDAVAVSNTSAIVFLDQNGMATFATTTLTTGTNPSEAAFGDVTGEGNRDVVVANGGSGTVGVYVGNGAGVFAAAATATLTVGASPTGLALADLDGDGVADIITSHGPNNTLNVLLSDP